MAVWIAVRPLTSTLRARHVSAISSRAGATTRCAGRAAAVAGLLGCQAAAWGGGTPAAEAGEAEPLDGRAALEEISRRLDAIEHRLAPRKRVIVVGAGIVGAAVAMELARAGGCEVTLLEADAEPASYSGTTAKSWAWLNSNSKWPEHYHRLNVAGMQRWREQSAVAVDWCGAVVSTVGPATQRYPDYPAATELSAEAVHQLEPALSVAAAADPALSWAYYPSEGMVDPVTAARAFAAEAARRGCRCRYNRNVLGVTLAPQGAAGPAVELQLEGGVALPADAVVLAVGNGLPELLESLGAEATVPMVEKPGLLVHTTPLPAGTLK
jgi:glycine/D-amino acid oxidase-like deaminating enzyme